VILNDFGSASHTSTLDRRLPLGYLRGTRKTGRTKAFYGSPGTFDPDLAQYDISNADTVTVGEALTQAGGFIPASYKGPVLLVLKTSSFATRNSGHARFRFAILMLYSPTPRRLIITLRRTQGIA
jgi:hypothetical protein